MPAAIEDDFARVRGVETGQHLHEGGFAGTVLPKQPVQGPGLDGERYPIIGPDRTEVLVDVPQLEAHCCAG